MFKLFQNFLPGEAEPETSGSIVNTNSDSADSLLAKLAQADVLWEQGKLREALAIYGLAIEQNPQSLEIQARLAECLKQQGDLAKAYEKLATGLKNNGNNEQAANYYRQAIHLKSLTGDTREKLLRSSLNNPKRSPIPLASLREAAFSFQPLTNVNSALTKTSVPQVEFDNVETETDRISPTFSHNIKAVNPQQAKDIDWETAQVYLQKALDHAEKQEWEKSALACKQATQILPTMAEAYKVWGNSLQRMGKTGEAMSCYAKAVKIQPDLAEVYAGIADIYAQQEKWQQSIKHYQKAIIIRPSAAIYRGMADVWKQMGEIDKAQLNLYRAAELEDSKAPSDRSDFDGLEVPESEASITKYCRLAEKLEQQNKWQQAAMYYRKALDISMAQPKLPAANANATAETGESNAEMSIDSANQNSVRTPASQLEKAIKRYHRQLRLQPNSPKIHTDLGNLYARKGKWQYAIACYRKAISLNPKYAKAHLNFARTLLKVSKQKEFIKEMQLALALEPKIGSAMDRFYLGNALADQGQSNQAISFYYKAIVLNPNFSQSYHRLSEILGQQGKHKEAMEFLKQGIEHNPQDAESFYFLGQQLELVSNWEGAVKIYSRVLQIEPKFPGASQKLNHALANKLKSLSK